MVHQTNQMVCTTPSKNMQHQLHGPRATTQQLPFFKAGRVSVSTHSCRLTPPMSYIPLVLSKLHSSLRPQKTLFPVPFMTTIWKVTNTIQWRVPQFWVTPNAKEEGEGKKGLATLDRGWYACGMHSQMYIHNERCWTITQLTCMPTARKNWVLEDCRGVESWQ